MIFVADESIDRQIVDRLRQDGHTVHYVAEMELEGAFGVLSPGSVRIRRLD